MYKILSNRAVIVISGADRSKFLQGLLTNDVNKIKTEDAIYACMLTPQGKYFADFFLKECGDKIFADIAYERKEEIINKLKIYKLRSDVEISVLPDYKVASVFVGKPDCNIAFIDPRCKKMAWRCYIKEVEVANVEYNDSTYDLNRIHNLIPEGDKDLIVDKSFIQEYGFDNLNAIDYQKGCYVGQELISRIHYSGVVRKSVFQIKAAEALPPIGTEIYANNIKIGMVCSSVIKEGLALIKKEEFLRLDSQRDLIADNIKIYVYS